MLGSTWICACESNTAQIGSDFFTDGVLDFSYVDTATVNFSTIQFEELTTSSANRMLVGAHDDDDLGKIIAIPFIQVTPSSAVDLEYQNVVYDYLSVVLPLDHYAYYDTLSPITLNVYRVTEDIATDKGNLYNSSSFAIENNAVGSITFKPKPHADSVEIILSDEFGLEIFQKAMEGSDDLNGAASFLKYIRGFAIVPDTTQSACILGLSTNPRLELHYIDKSVTPVVERSATFDVQTNSGLYFTHITADRKHTRLNVLPPAEEKLSAVLTDGKAYIQAGTGLGLRVDIPYLRTLKQLVNFYPTQAILEIFPVRKSFDDATKLPSELQVFKADEHNAIHSEIETPAYLVEDLELGRDTYYTFDATEFVKEQMELQSQNENALIFTTDNANFPISTERIYAAAPGYQYKTRLRIYFATVNN